MLVPSITLAFICSDMLKKERSHGFVVNGIAENINGFQKEVNINSLTSSAATEVELDLDVAEGRAVMPEKGTSFSGKYGGGCGSGCGSGGCGNAVKSGGCGGGCGSGSGCGNCGGACGDFLRSGGCGGSCGGSGCGGCGAGCGNFIKGGDTGIVANNGCEAKIAESDNSCTAAPSKDTQLAHLREAVAA